MPEHMRQRTNNEYQHEYEYVLFSYRLVILTVLVKSQMIKAQASGKYHPMARAIQKKVQKATAMHMEKVKKEMEDKMKAKEKQFEKEKKEMEGKIEAKEKQFEKEKAEKDKAMNQQEKQFEKEKEEMEKAMKQQEKQFEKEKEEMKKAMKQQEKQFEKEKEDAYRRGELAVLRYNEYVAAREGGSTYPQDWGREYRERKGL